MRINKNEPPREFEVGFGPKVVMKDCAHVELAANEQITLKTDSGAEYDVARKNWGFYATPSINGRLERFGLRAMLVKNRLEHFYVMLVERGHDTEFHQYLSDEGLKLCGCLDESTLLEVERSLTPDS